jgi:DNA-binding IclR family transcriptional regulator
MQSQQALNETAIAETAGATKAEKNRIPVIDRMLDMLELIERRAQGASIRELSAELSVPRSTVYRVLNTLESRQMVRRGQGGAYVLGPRLINLAANVTDTEGTQLAQLAANHLERLAMRTGQSTKFTIVYGEMALVVACAQGTSDFALTVRPGQTVPLHAGAASKILLANLDEADRERILSKPLIVFTSDTITDRKVMAAELRKAREANWATDHSEHCDGVHAIAAPVFNSKNRVIAAISIPYLPSHNLEQDQSVRGQLLETAQRISADIKAYNL